jgi:hypothetical protein
MPWVGFEPTIPASEWAKIVHALDRAATVSSRIIYQFYIISDMDIVVMSEITIKIINQTGLSEIYISSTPTVIKFLMRSSSPTYSSTSKKPSV